MINLVTSSHILTRSLSSKCEISNIAVANIRIVYFTTQEVNLNIGIYTFAVVSGETRLPNTLFYNQIKTSLPNLSNPSLHLFYPSIITGFYEHRKALSLMRYCV